MDVSVIITTYNHPRWLEKVIWGFETQTHQDFELVIADDGSGEETRSTISRLAEETGLRIHHVWHEDRGFRKCEILNQGIAQSSHEYLVFVDGDCVPCQDFLETHVRFAAPGRFLSGGIVRLPMDISSQLTRHDIQKGRATDPAWLRRQGMKGTGKFRLLTKNASIGAFLDFITTTRPTFNGHNASAWKDDLLRVNGFDHRMKYGGLDRELGERLVNSGVRGKQIRHRAGCIHLNHSRGYENAQSWKQNNAIRGATQKTGRQRTDHGIAQRPSAA